MVKSTASSSGDSWKTQKKNEFRTEKRYSYTATNPSPLELFSAIDDLHSLDLDSLAVFGDFAVVHCLYG